MKSLLLRGTVEPTKMRQAGTANRYSPAITREPAEFFSCRPYIPAAPRLPEAANLKYNAIWIKKGMLLRALNFDPLARAGDYCAALGTEDMLFFLFLFLVFFLYQLFSLAFWQWDAQEVLAGHFFCNLIHHIL